MMKNKLWMVLVGAVILTSIWMTPQEGHAAVSVDIYGGGVGTNPSADPGAKRMAAVPAGGITLNVPVSVLVDIQFSSLYLTRKTSILGFEDTHRLVGGELGFKLKLFSHFYIDAGAYYNHRLNNPIELVGPDWGGYAGLGLTIPVSDSVRILIHPQYHRAARSLSHPAGKYTPDELLGFIGFSFGRQGKY